MMATWLASVLLRGLIVCAVGVLVATMLTRRPAAHRALAWTLTLAALGALPWVGALAPTLELPVLPAEERLGEQDAATPRPAQPRVQVEPEPASPPRAVGVAPAPRSIPALTPTRQELVAEASGQSTSFDWRGALGGVVQEQRLATAAGAVWLIVAAVLLLRVGRGWLAAYRLQLTSCAASASLTDELREIVRRAGGREPALRISTQSSLPMALHLAEPMILVPSDFGAWPAERRRAVLLHELAHLRRLDTWVQSLARIIVSLHWPNPLAWVALRRLLVERERACDDHVLRAGLVPSSYATHLLELARLPRTHVPAAAAPFLRRRQLPDRVRAVLNPKLVRESPTRRSLVFATVLSLLALVPIAAGQPVDAASAEPSPTISQPEPTSTPPSATIPATAAQQQPHPTIDELVKMRIHGVTPAFVEAMSQYEDNLDVATLVQLRIHGVSPEYADQMYSTLGESLTLRQLVQGRIHGVSADFARVAALQFGQGVSFSDLVQMRIHGASSDFVRTMQELLPNETLAVSDVVQMRIHGVGPDMVRDLHDRGIDDLTVAELVKMRIHGIDRVLRRRDGDNR